MPTVQYLPIGSNFQSQFEYPRDYHEKALPQNLEQRGENPTLRLAPKQSQSIFGYGSRDLEVTDCHSQKCVNQDNSIKHHHDLDRPSPRSILGWRSGEEVDSRQNVDHGMFPSLFSGNEGRGFQKPRDCALPKSTAGLGQSNGRSSILVAKEACGKEEGT